MTLSEGDPSNRRSEPRQAIALHALVHPRRGRSWMCTIRDFCRGGMLLMSEPGQPTLPQVGADPRAADPVHIHFSLPEGNGQRHFRLRALIARVFDTGAGVGVRLPDGMDPAILTALERFAGAGATSSAPAVHKRGGGFAEARDSRVSERDAERARQQLRRMMERALPRIARTFFERADKDLLVRARDAGSNQLQAQFFEAMSALERKRKAVEADLLRDVLEQMDSIHELDEVLERRRRKEAAASQAQKLALVDTERFEEWLAVAEIVSKAEARSQQALSDIRKRMALLARPWANKEVNPVSPAVITRALDDALDQVELDRAVRQALYRTLQEALLPLLRNLYGSINKLLDDLGVFPPIDTLNDPLPAVVRRPVPPVVPPAGAPQAPPDAPAAAAPGQAPGTVAPWPGAPAGTHAAVASPGNRPLPLPGTPVAAPGAGMPPAGAGMGVTPAWSGGDSGNWASRTGTFTRGGAAAGGAAAGGGAAAAASGGGFGTGSWASPGAVGAPPEGRPPTPAAIAGRAGGGRIGDVGAAFTTARELLHLQRRTAVGGPGPVLATEDPAQAFGSLEVVAALSELQQRGLVKGSPLRSQLVDVLKRRSLDGDRRLSVADADALQVVENLVSSIEQDDLVTPGVKSWVRQLEVTLAKVAAAQPDFLNSSSAAPHPAIQVLNQLARLGNATDAGEGIDREVGARVDELISASSTASTATRRSSSRYWPS
jgi:hypothetical protein